MKKRRFRHLSWTDRLKIEQMLKDGRHYQDIADEIGVPVSYTHLGADTGTETRKQRTGRRVIKTQGTPCHPERRQFEQRAQCQH